MDISVIEKNLVKQLKYVIAKSEFYQEKYKDIDFKEINMGMFDSLPFTDKQEIIDDQIKNKPFGKNICVEIEDIARVHKTSGTTGRPVLIALTKKDIKNATKVGAECFKSAGLSKKDLVIHCLNYCMWSGGYTDHQCLEETGAAVIPFGTGNSDELIDIILEVKPSAIHCTPSYLARLENLLKDKYNLLPKDLGIKLGLFGGEGGIQNPKFRNALEGKWGMKAMNANYGVSEVLSIYGAECSERNGLHFFGTEIIYPELINPSTKKKVKIEKDAVGELVITNLKKEAQPLVRYRTHDLIRVISTECKCGNSGFKFDIIGRSDDMLVIKGLNVFPKSIDGIIKDNIEYLTGEYRIIVSKDDPKDYIKIKVEKKSDINISEETLTKILHKDFKNKITVVPLLEIVEEGVLPRTEGKTKHVVLE